jgi:hypothetical protein
MQLNRLSNPWLLLSAGTAALPYGKVPGCAVAWICTISHTKRPATVQDYGAIRYFGTECRWWPALNTALEKRQNAAM